MVIDRSGSMATMGPEVAGGINAYLDKQRTDDKEGQVGLTMAMYTCELLCLDGKEGKGSCNVVPLPLRKAGRSRHAMNTCELLPLPLT